MSLFDGNWDGSINDPEVYKQIVDEETTERREDEQAQRKQQLEEEQGSMIRRFRLTENQLKLCIAVTGLMLIFILSVAAVFALRQ
jgi:hypothetical protein